MRRVIAAWLLAVAIACSRNPGPSEPLADATLAARDTAGATASVVVIGDFGVGGTRQRAVAEAIRDHAVRAPLDALVTTGDNIYPSGAPAAFENAWHRPFGWIDRAGIPVIASLGNHDLRTGDGRYVMELFHMPGRYYSRRVGPVEFIVLDANRPADPEQLTFLEQTLRSSAAPWQVAVFHQPAHSCGKHGSTPALQREWVPIFERAGLDLALAGHDHSYQRFEPVGGVRYIVTGGGGAGLTGIGQCPRGTPRPAATLVHHHFVTLEATAGEIRLAAVSVRTGQIEDHIVITGASIVPSPTGRVSPSATGGAP